MDMKLYGYNFYQRIIYQDQVWEIKNCEIPSCLFSHHISQIITVTDHLSCSVLINNVKLNRAIKVDGL